MTSATSKSTRTIEEFKSAARRVFAEQGYTAAKIVDISAAAGKATGGIYRYFDSKPAILKALVDDLLRARHQRVMHTSGHGHTMTTEDDVRDHVEAYWHTYQEYLPEMVAITEAAMSDPVFADLRQRIRGKDVAIWRAHVKELRAHLGKPTADAATIAQLVVSLLEQYCYTTVHLGRGGSRKQVNALTTFVYGGITR